MTRKNRLIVAAATFTVISLLAATSAAGMTITQRAQLGTLAALPTTVSSAVLQPENTPAAVIPELVATATNSPKTKNASVTAAPAAVPTTTSPVTPPPPPTVSTAVAQRGEGVIAIVKRTCGHALGWQKVAAANNIFAPVYLVLNQQKLTVDCSLRGTVAPLPAPVVPAAAAPAPAAAPQGGGLWYHPLPGKCRAWGGGGDYLAPRPLGATGSAIRYQHQGIDFGASTGTDIHAAGGGEVIFAGWAGSGAGNQVQIRVGNLVFKHNHMSTIWVRTGQWVNPDQLIGEVGETGNAKGAHLHLEVWRNGQHINPVDFLAGEGIRVRC